LSRIPANAALSRFVLRHATAIVAVFAIVICTAGIFQRGLWTPDEPREAEIGREMLVSGWSSMPTLSGVAFLEKPPFFPWVMAASYHAFGVSPGVARLPAALFGVGAMLVAYFLGRRAGGRSAGMLSAVVIATSVGFAMLSHSATNDTALVFFVSAGHLALLAARDDHRASKRSWNLALAGLCAGAAFITKGFIGPVLLVGPALAASALMREWAYLRFAFLRLAAWSMLCVTAIGLPWVLALAQRGGWPAVRVCLWDNTLGRSVSALNSNFGHTKGPLYYLEVLPADLLPWTLAIPALLFGTLFGTRFGTRIGAASWRRWRSERARFLGLVFCAGIVLLSIPATKRGQYAVPLYPCGAAVLGVWLSRVGSRRGGRFDRAALAAIHVVLGIALLAISAGLVYISTSATLPEKARPAIAMILANTEPAQRYAASIAALLLAVFVFGSGLATSASNVSQRIWAATLSTCATILFWHACATPIVDPIKDMERGVFAASAAIPRDEPLLGLNLDETTLAVMPYYTGRMVRRVPTMAEALVELSNGPAGHLMVLDSAEGLIDPAARARLRLVTTLDMNATRRLSIYAFER
jgi:4-amino-4-deoxy-L-arabinose transferase-like glycosyltransferase